MKACIVGAGAIGGLLGARLADAGHAVSLVARGAHLAALRANGLAIKDDAGVRTRALPASDEPADFGPQDVVVIALKAYSIGPMLPRIARLLTPDTAVVTAINGIPWWYFCRAGGTFDGASVECLVHDDLIVLGTRLTSKPDMSDVTRQEEKTADARLDQTRVQFIPGAA